ncbi:MAG: CopG family transcriptional regulator [Coriobacteriia bacterium]|nr:CopG family transcriptional regulator [Coriobacteriia bacterium]
MKASEFDKKFDDGVEDIMGDLDMSTAVRLNEEQRRVNVDLPSWMIESLDREARRVGVSRQAVIKFWLAERLEKAG